MEAEIAKLGSIKLSYNIEGTSVNVVFLESKIYIFNGTIATTNGVYKIKDHQKEVYYVEMI